MRILYLKLSVTLSVLFRVPARLFYEHFALRARAAAAEPEFIFAIDIIVTRRNYSSGPTLVSHLFCCKITGRERISFEFVETIIFAFQCETAPQTQEATALYCLYDALIALLSRRI